MTPLLQVKHLQVQFAVAGRGLFNLRPRQLNAVNGASLTLAAGQTLGLVGESGCGKSTLARAVLQLTPATGGQVLFDGLDIGQGDKQAVARLRREAAMIFQDPYTALNPRQRVGQILAEVLQVQRKVPAAQIPARVVELLELVGLRAELAERKPGALSGGQCQRVGIARALAIEPRLIVADECVAALDVSIQGQIINLLLELRERMGLALLFITHDLGVVRQLCDRVAVMYLGQIVEEGPVHEVFDNPRHPYTAALVQAIADIDPARGLPAQPLAGEPPSPLQLPAGCAFHPRCPHALPQCRDSAPPSHTQGARRHACIHPQLPY